MEMKLRTGTQKKLGTLLSNIAACLDSVQAWLVALREVQSQTGGEVVHVVTVRAG